MSWSWLKLRGEPPPIPIVPAEPVQSAGSVPSAITPAVSATSGQTAISAVAKEPEKAKPVRVGVLLDGDADYFTRVYTSKGRQGGRCAALELKNHVERYIRKERLDNPISSVETVALSFANNKGLSRFLGDDIASFAQGFKSSPCAFTMSDVGDIPQGADIAMKSHLPFLLSTCDYVLFGGSHDNGYSQILAGLEAAKQRDKVIILRTTPYCAEKILLLGLNEVRFPLLFEGRDPTERSRPTPSGSAAQAPSLQKLATLATPNTPYASVAARAPSTPASASYVAEVKPDFKPLIRLLLARRSLPVPELRPVWSQIGIDLKELPDCPIEVGKKNEVKAYILGASSVGIVKVGRNQGPGSEWVQLLLSAETAQQRLQASSTAVSKQAADEGTVATYWMLVETLRSQPNYRARLSNLASMVLTQWARFWSKGFRKYIEGARAAGYVQISAVPGDASDIMVELQLRYRPSTSGGTKASPSHPSTFPAKFLPLVEAFSEGKVSTLKAHRLATRFSSGMLNAKLKPFESGKWQEYLDEAEKLGLVTLSKVKGEKQLVTIKGG